MKSMMRKVLTIVLAVAMIFTSSAFSLQAFAATDEAQNNFETQQVENAAFDQTENVNGTVVKLSAKEGVLPAGTKATVKALSLSKVKTLLGDKATDIKDAAMFSVAFEDADGNTAQPNGKVQVAISSLSLSGDEAVAYTVSESGINTVDTFGADAKNVTFEAGNVDNVGVVAYEATKEDAQASTPTSNKKAAKKATGLSLASEEAGIATAADTGSDEYPYIGYKWHNKTFSVEDNGKNDMNLTVSNKDGSENYIAYCYNERRERPAAKADGGRNYKKKWPSATPEDFQAALYDPDFAHHVNVKSADELYKDAMNVLYAGYPFDKAGMRDYAVNTLRVSEEKADDTLRLATQYALWHFTDDLTISKYDAAAYKKLAYQIIEYAKAATAAPSDFILDIYSPEVPEGKTTPQNLLTTRVEEGTKPKDPKTVTSNEGGVKATLKAKKVLNGGTLANEQFTFELYEGNTKIGEAKNDASGNIVFPEMTFAKAGTYTFTIKEKNDGQAGIQYDTAAKTVTVTVSEHSVQTYDESATYYGYETDDWEYVIDVTETGTGIRMYCTNKESVGPQGDGNVKGLTRKDQTYKAVINPSQIIASTDSEGASKGSMIFKNNYGANLEKNLKALMYFFESDTVNNLSFDECQKLVWAATGSVVNFSKAMNINGVQLSKTAGATKVLDTIFANVQAPEGYNLAFFLPSDKQYNAGCTQPLMTGYGSVIDYKNGEAPTFTNTQQQVQKPKTEVSVEKEWNDAKNQDGIRPASVTVRLYADGVNTNKSVTLSDANGWKDSFVDLDEENADGAKIAYTVKEDAVTGYTSTVTANADNTSFTVDNKHEVEKTKVEGTKNWKNDKASDRPASIEVILKADGVETARTTTTADKNWEYSFTNLNKYKQGNEIVYTVEEASVPKNYEATVDGFDLVNTYTQGKVSVPVSKHWNDDGNRDKMRPGSVKVHLYSDESGMAKDTGKFVTLNEGNGWQDAFTNLDEFAYDNGKKTKINYTVVEDDVEGYTAAIEATEQGGFAITNTHGIKTTSVKGEKIWKDRSAATRPASITVTLLANGTAKATKNVTAENGWKFSFDNLPENEGGDKIVYTVQENAMGIYEGTVGTEANDFAITNTEITHEVEISKINVAGEELEGAELSITGTDVDGNNIEPIEWISDGTSKKVTVNPGTYTLTETTAPKGYKVAESITFSVDKDGNVTVDGEANDGVITMVDGYKDQTVEISKTDVGGKELEGAKLKVTGKDADGKDIEPIEWISGKETKKISVQPGTYTLTETTAPKGYEEAESITFKVSLDDEGNTVVTVNGKDNNGKVTMVDGYSDQTVEISKTDVGGKELEGAKLKVTGKDASGKDIKPIEWTSGKETKKISVQPGTYTLTETTAPKGYEVAESITFKVALDEDGNAVVTVDGKDNNGKVTMVDGYKDQTVEISKTDVGGKELEGAKLKVTGKDASGKDIKPIEWTSGKETKKISVQPGTYTLTETTAPKGYEVAESITFKVALDEDGNAVVTVDGKDNNGKVTMVDGYSDQTVEISKTDVGGKELEGAKLKVTGKDASGKDIEPIEWTSGKETKKISVQPGTYTLTETTAPKGYEVAESITFKVSLDDEGNTVVTVNGKDNNGNVTMVDGYSDQTVEISKTDVGGKELEGAKLKVTGKDASGKDIEPIEWTSGKETKKISVQPGTYTLTETTAPKGYEVAESITFKVALDEDGNAVVTVDGKDNNGKVTMVDGYSDQTVEISKTDVGGKELEGAKLTVTGKDVSGNEIEPIEWTSGKETKKISVQPGTYTLTETTAPKGYEVAESIVFEVSVDENGNTVVTVDGKDNNGKVTMVDDYSTHKVIFSKTDIGGEELEGATIELQNKETGEVIENWVTDGKAKEFELKPGTYVFHEVAAPDGYLVATDITFEVTLTGDIVTTDVEVAGEDKNTIVMVDDFVPEKPSSETPSKNEQPKNNTPSKTTTTVHTTKTGDDTNYALYLILMVGAAAAAAFGLRRSKREEDR